MGVMRSDTECCRKITAIVEKKVSQREPTFFTYELQLIEIFSQECQGTAEFRTTCINAFGRLLEVTDHTTGGYCNYITLALEFVEKVAHVFRDEDLTKLVCNLLRHPHDDIYKEGDRERLLRYLLHVGAPINACDDTGDTPIFLVSRLGRARLFEVLVEAGADVSAEYSRLLPSRNPEDNKRFNLLELALDAKYLDIRAEADNLDGIQSLFPWRWDDIIRSLLRKGLVFDIDHPMIGQLLHWACVMGQMDLVDIILKTNTRTSHTELRNIPSVYQWTLPYALDGACMRGRTELVKRLLQLGADPRLPFSPETGLPVRFQGGELSTVKAKPASAFHRCVSRFGKRCRPEDFWDDMASYLELIVTSEPGTGEYPSFEDDCRRLLQNCINFGHTDVAERLLQRGVRPLKITEGNSPAAIELAVAYGAEIDWKSLREHAMRQDQTAMVLKTWEIQGMSDWQDTQKLVSAARFAGPDVLQLLIEHCNLNINEAFKTGWSWGDEHTSLLATAISHLQGSERPGRALMLLQMGADPDLPGLPYNAKEAMQKESPKLDRCNLAIIRESILPVVRFLYGTEKAFPSGWTEEHTAQQRKRYHQMSCDKVHPEGLCSEYSAHGTEISTIRSYEQRYPRPTRLPTDGANCLLSPTYKYRDIGSLPGTIRLLRMEPSKSSSHPVECSVVLTRLTDAPQFEILTGDWAQRDLKGEIILDGHAESLPVELVSALQLVRSQNQTRLLWIRPVCINLRDTQEANRQMALFRDIHRVSSQLIVWLGEATENADFVFLEMREYPQELDEGDSDSEVNVGWLPATFHRKTTSRPHYTTEAKEAYEALCQRSWFYLPWTEAELALSDSVMLMCGDNAYASKTSRSTGVLQQIDQLYWPWKPLKEAGGWEPNRPRLEGTCLLAHLAKCGPGLDLGARARRYWARVIALTLSTSGEFLSDHYRRELVYSMAARSALPLFEVNYSSSMAEVFRDIAEASMDKDLTMLREYDFSRKVVPGLPSWVPDLTQRVMVAPLFPSIYRGGEFNDVFARPQIRGDRLTLHGLTLEKITGIGPAMDDKNGGEPGEDDLRRVFSAWETLASNMDPTCIKRSAAEGLLHSMTCQQDPCSSFSWRDCRFFVHWCDSYGNGSLRTADPSWYDDIEVAEAWLTNKDACRNSYQSKDEYDQHDLKRMHRLYNCFRRTTLGRRFYVTERGNMGLAPGGAREGDVLIHFLTDTSLQRFPYTLRPQKDDTFSFVGCTYVYAWDAPERFKAGEIKSEDFVIV